VRRPHPLDLLGTQALEVVKEDAAHFVERVFKSPVFLGACGFKREPVALHYTKSENIWLTRFPAGSLANDTLHTVTLFDALKIDNRRVDRGMCKKYTYGLQLYMQQALKIKIPEAGTVVRTIY
jgi:hypothetical protein